MKYTARLFNTTMLQIPVTIKMYNISGRNVRLLINMHVGIITRIIMSGY